MVQDVNTGIAWVLRKVERHGGDADRVFLVGQSAGGQLAMLALLNQAAQAASGEAVWGGAPVWHPQGLAGYVGVSEWQWCAGLCYSTWWWWWWSVSVGRPPQGVCAEACSASLVCACRWRV
jgi:alpha-beta hydrolase superfamily lysophospholipase